jgi:hypothetical protein
MESLFFDILKWLKHKTPGGFIAGAICFIIIFIFFITIANTPLGGEGLGDVACLFACFFSTIAVFLGAIGSLLAPRIARRLHPETSLGACHVDCSPERLTHQSWGKYRMGVR